MLKSSFLLMITFFSLNALANPAPLCIKINKDTLQDVEKKYKIIRASKNATEGFFNNILDIKSIQIKGLSKANVVTNKDKVVEAVLLEIHRDRFDEIYAEIAKKYKLVKSKLPSIGDKLALLEDGDCFIEVTSQHLEFKMYALYTTKGFYHSVLSRLKQEDQQRKEKTAKLL